MSSCEYTVDELLQQRKNILEEIDSEYEDVSSSGARFGCDCGCGGDYSSDYIDSLQEELHDVEQELTLRGICF